eukprot:3663776-Prymnesium_polylepis.1
MAVAAAAAAEGVEGAVAAAWARAYPGQVPAGAGIGVHPGGTRKWKPNESARSRLVRGAVAPTSRKHARSATTSGAADSHASRITLAILLHARAVSRWRCEVVSCVRVTRAPASS